MLLYIVGNRFLRGKYTNYRFENYKESLTSKKILESFPQTENLRYFFTKKEALEYSKTCDDTTPYTFNVSLEFFDRAVFMVRVNNLFLEQQLMEFFQSKDEGGHGDGSVDLHLITYIPSDFKNYPKSYICIDIDDHFYSRPFYYVNLSGEKHRIKIDGFSPLVDFIKDSIGKPVSNSMDKNPCVVKLSREHFVIRLSRDDVNRLISVPSGFIPKNESLAPKINRSKLFGIISASLHENTSQLSDIQEFQLTSTSFLKEKYSKLIPKNSTYVTNKTTNLLPLIDKYQSGFFGYFRNSVNSIDNLKRAITMDRPCTIPAIVHSLLETNKETDGDYFSLLQVMIDYLETREFYAFALEYETGIPRDVCGTIYDYLKPEDLNMSNQLKV